MRASLRIEIKVDVAACLRALMVIYLLIYGRVVTPVTARFRWSARLTQLRSASSARTSF
jgi:hypothetical protein